MSVKGYLQEIYKVEAEKYAKTREIHWKVNISIWTVVVVAIYAKTSKNINLSGFSLGGILTMYTVFIFTHAAFVYKIHRSMYRSLNRMTNMVVHLLERKDEPIRWRDFERKTAPSNYYWELLQVVITIFLISIFHFF